MSLINKVLRDLDRRNATPGSAEAVPPKVRVVEAKAASHEWFWRLVSGLVLIALGWVGWVLYQIQPRPIATELAQQVDEARARRATKPPAALAAAPKPLVQPLTEPAPAPKPRVEVGATVLPPKPAAAPAQPAETLRFAYSIETPIGAPAPKPLPAKRSGAPAENRQKPAPVKSVQGAGKSSVERRDRALSGPERADSEFRRGVDLLKRGRAGEAEGAFIAAMRADATHHGARQALVALKLERGLLAEASQLLEEALAINTEQPDFAVAMARIHVERGRLPAALEVLDAAVSPAANFAEFHVLRGSVLQRLGRHAEAAQAYRAGLTMQPAIPQAWMGLGISLEALQQRTAAADAFRNALAAGPVSSELKTFAEQRIQALR